MGSSAAKRTRSSGKRLERVSLVSLIEAEPTTAPPKPLGPEQIGIIAQKVAEDIRETSSSLDLLNREQGDHREQEQNSSPYGTHVEARDEFSPHLQRLHLEGKMRHLLMNQRDIMEGKFTGICTHCGKNTIPLDRFLALPDTRTCIGCAQMGFR